MRKKIKNNVSWIGYIDWELKRFHGDDYSVFNGSSQNAYLIEEEKTVLVDTVWVPHSSEFIDNLQSETDIEKIDLIIVNHGEPDHSGSLPELLGRIPNVPIYCTAAAVKSLEGQYGKRGWNFHTVKTGDKIDIGNGKSLTFIEMKMLHWPDSMATYMSGDDILFSNDAFGQHFAVEELFNDKADRCLLLHEAMKYFANILNPYADFVKRKIAEIRSMNLSIDMIATSHGAIWREDPMQIIDMYAEWADAYSEDRVTVIYDTMWEGTAKIAHEIAREISRQSPDTVVKVYNVSKSDKNDIMTEIFKSRAIALGCPTVGGDIMSNVSGLLTFIKYLNFKNKKAAAFGCYGWSGEGTRILRERLEDAGFCVVGELRILWSIDPSGYEKIPALALQLLN